MTAQPFMYVVFGDPCSMLVMSDGMVDIHEFMSLGELQI